MQFEEIVRWLHSWTRWLFLLIALAAIVYFVLGVVQKRAWVKQAQTALTVFSSSIGVQWVIGIVLFALLWAERGGVARQHWEHTFAQTVALGVAHLHFRWRKQDMPDANRWRNGLLLMVGVLVIIILGIFSLNQLIPGTPWRIYTGG
jgi:dolichol kinase